MQNKVIYIAGPACPYTQKQISAENNIVRRDLKSLRAAGHEDILIGNPKDGFALSDVTKTMHDHPEAHLIIVAVHGNLDRKKHYLQVLPSDDSKDKKIGRIWARSFYKTLSAGSQNSPLNVFMFSCGSGASCATAVRHLPRGSTLFNLVEENRVDSYNIIPDALKMAVNDGDNLAERLFLNILFKGLSNGSSYPQVNVSMGGHAAGNVWSLWDLAKDNVLDAPLGNHDFEKQLANELSIYSSPEKISTAIKTIELYMKALAMRSVEDQGVPVKIGLKIDFEGLKRSVCATGLMGPMCAIGYYLNKDSIGAFQTWPRDRYLGPIVSDKAITIRLDSIPTAILTEIERTFPERMTRDTFILIPDLML